MKRRVGSSLVLLGGLALACVSGGSDDPAKDGPECYSNADCTAGHECSGGICVGFYGCGSATDCRHNYDCYDNVCRLPCSSTSECEDEGLYCDTALGGTQHCRPSPNPTRNQTMTQSGTGSTGSTTGSGGMASVGGKSGTGGIGGATTLPSAGMANTVPGGGGLPNAAGGPPAAAGSFNGVAGMTPGATAGRPGL